jgi:hypothetical protein
MLFRAHNHRHMLIFAFLVERFDFVGYDLAVHHWSGARALRRSHAGHVQSINNRFRRQRSQFLQRLRIIARYAALLREHKPDFFR